jgi:hypothetical protein
MGDIVNAGLDLVGAGPGSALKAGSKKAARLADAANQKAQAVTDQQYEAQKNYLNPYAQVGNAALSRQSDLLGLSGNTGAAGYGTYGPGSQFNMTQLEQDPGYQFRLEQGQKALDNSVAARGMNLSGQQLKGTAAYNQGAASQEYGNAYQRYMDRYKTLGDTVSGGYTANNQLANYAGQYGANKSNLYTGGGQDQANAAMQQGRIQSDIVGGWGAALNQGMGMMSPGGWFGGDKTAPANNLGNQYLPGGGYDSSTSFGQGSYKF